MKKIIILFSLIICISASMLTDTAAVYRKTLPVISGSVTAKNSICLHYPYWSFIKELAHQYKINDIVQYAGKHFKRINSGSSQNYLPPDKNKSWVEIECNRC